MSTSPMREQLIKDLEQAAGTYFPDQGEWVRSLLKAMDKLGYELVKKPASTSTICEHIYDEGANGEPPICNSQDDPYVIRVPSGSMTVKSFCRHCGSEVQPSGVGNGSWVHKEKRPPGGTQYWDHNSRTRWQVLYMEDSPGVFKRCDFAVGGPIPPHRVPPVVR